MDMLDQAKGGIAANPIHLITSTAPRYCSVCGENIVDPVTGAAFIGIEFRLSVDRKSANCDSDLAFFKKQLGIYGGGLEKDSPLLIDLCWEC